MSQGGRVPSISWVIRLKFLRIIGCLPDHGDRAVSVVGARDAGPDGLEQARRIGAALARAGAWVVSGGARGIDAASHSGAVEAGGRTVVVVAGGLDHLYPAENRGLFARVVESGGCLVAECEDGVRPWRWSFPRRNRIVAALGEATVVVRAGARSGALLTAAEAARIGQRVLVAAGVEGEGGEGLRRLAGSGALEFGTVEGLLGSLGFGAAEAVPSLPAEVEPGGRMQGLWGALGEESPGNRRGGAPGRGRSGGGAGGTGGARAHRARGAEAGQGIRPARAGRKRRMMATAAKAGSTEKAPRGARAAKKAPAKAPAKAVAKVAAKEPAKTPAKGRSRDAKGTLVIVESPAKAKTIKKYLGRSYEVLASVGHIMDLPKSKLGVDVDHGFEPQYVVIRDKNKVVSDIKKAARGAERILLATDPDREGEAIAWHLSMELGAPGGDDRVQRVLFNDRDAQTRHRHVREGREQ